MKRLATCAFLGLVILTLVGAIYLGAFERIEIEEQVVGPYSFIYREMYGADLRKLGVITSDLDLLLTQHGVVQRRPFDVFYPQAAHPNEVGFILTADVAKDALARIAAAPDVKIREVPRQRALLTRFPWKSRLSFLVGFLKVDPALRAYRQKAGYHDAPAYSLNEGPTIAYMQPILQ